MKKIVLFIFFAYSIFFFLIPPLQAPDEPGHYEVVYWVSQGIYPYVGKHAIPNPHPYSGTLSQYFNIGIGHPFIIPHYTYLPNSPVEKSIDIPQKNLTPITSQAYNPPVYYVVGAAFFAIARFFHTNLLTQFYAIRLSSAVWYFATIFLAIKIIEKFFENKSTQKTALLFFGLNPLLLNAGISTNPDIAITFFVTLFLSLILRTETKNLTKKKNLFFFGFIAGLATLSKISGVVLVPTLLLYLFIQRQTLRTWITESFIFLITFVLTQIPWSMFNFFRYHEIVVSEVALGPNSKTFVTNPLVAFFSAAWEFRHTFFHYAGFFGWNDIHPSSFIFISYAFLFIMFLIVGIYHLYKQRKNEYMLLLFVMTCMFIFFYLISLDRKLFYPVWDIQGRYILPIFLPMTITIFLGTQNYLNKKIKKLTNYFGYFAIMYYFSIVFFILIPRFYV